MILITMLKNIYVYCFAYLVRSTSEGSDGDDRIGTIRCHTSKIMIANFFCRKKVNTIKSLSYEIRNSHIHCSLIYGNKFNFRF